MHQNKCPRCGDNLVSRNGKFGNFKGCSSFP
ncbi:topoisomerase DNA-binding C4 zinc finger domain-containing protein [Pedobacter sp. AK017]